MLSSLFRRSRNIALASSMALAMSVQVAAASAQCVLEWTQTGSGANNGVVSTNPVFATAVNVLTPIGTDLYAGGIFNIAGGAPAGNVAKWNGTTWSALGSGVSYIPSRPSETVYVNAITEYNGGIYVAGKFDAAGGSNSVFSIARWDGSSYSKVGQYGIFFGAFEGYVNAMVVYNNALYVGGQFDQTDFVSNTTHIAKWDGSSWSTVGGGLNERIVSMVQHNGLLYANGYFQNAGAVSLPDRVASWNGTNWSPVPLTGITAFGTPDIRFSKLFSVGGDLYFAVRYTTPGVFKIAKWNGASWDLLSGEVGPTPVNSFRFLEVFDDGTGPALYVSGGFSNIVTPSGNVAASNIAKWNGTTWSAVGAGVGSGPLAAFNGKLYLGSRSGTLDPHLPRVNPVIAWSCNATGACCLPNGSCDIRTAYSCYAAAGAYQGDNSICGTCLPAPTGACCTTSGCVVLWRDGAGGCLTQPGGVYLGDGTTCASVCPAREVEPNDDRSIASAITLSSGGKFAGVTTGAIAPGGASESRDYFRLSTASAPLGIYRQRLSIDSTLPGHVTSVKGQGQNLPLPGVWPGPIGTANSSEITLADGLISGTSRVHTWYGFGKQEQISLRVDGVLETPDAYVGTLQTTPVTPTDLGSFPFGSIALSTVDGSAGPDTGLRVFDANLSPIVGYSNDGATTNGGSTVNDVEQSYLSRSYAPGTYYVAVTNGGVLTNIGTPCDDGSLLDSTILKGVTDFADLAIARPSKETTYPYPVNVGFRITDSAGVSTPVPATIAAAGDIAWFKFTVPYGVGNVVVDDTTGNGNSNNYAEPGETSLKLTVPFIKSIAGSINGITATLTSQTATATITSGTSTYPNLAAAGSVNNTTPFGLSLSPSHPCGAPVNLRLSVQASGGASIAAVNFSIPTGAPVVAQSVSWAGPATAIPDTDNNGINAVVSVSGVTGNIVDLNLLFNNSGACATSNSSTTGGLQHPNLGDVIITLTSPQGTTATVINMQGGSGNHLCSTLFDDEASNVFPNGMSQPYTGAAQPTSPFTVFDGQNPNGNWLLNVKDVVTGNTGTLRAFSLVITPSPACDEPGNACPADFNNDSVRDVADLFAYINAWLAKAASADFNDDNTVDVADLFAYINAWLAGC